MIDPDEIDKSADGIFITRSQSRAIDQLAIRKFGIPGIVLMENAGRGCTDQLRNEGCQGPVVVLCGPGNNGGDGFVMARQLAEGGVEVKLLV
ncbi:MAG: NAD(P)H-hydrate epimerase, partial [Planctomycetaceae bacterium]